MLWPTFLLLPLFLAAPPVERDEVAGGLHWRVMTDRGAVHVWRPRDYRPAHLGIVVYVHGYWTSPDSAWQEYKLPEQFARSRQNAVFIVPAAPAEDNQDVVWKDLGELLTTVFRATRQRVPGGPLVAVGHSGAFRTIVPWLAHPRLRQVFLLDGLYNSEEAFASWLQADRQAKKLVLVAVDTYEKTEKFVLRFRGAASRIGLPDRLDDFSSCERNARLLYVKATVGHMELVTEGKAIPLVLRLSWLAKLGAPKLSALESPTFPQPG